MQMKKYPAKVLLFGEYTVLEGAQALAIPFAGKTGRWEHKKTNDSVNAALESYLKWLRNEKSVTAYLDIPRFEKDLIDGWVFESAIPDGYGLGSSGALCAAIYDRYLLQNSGSGELELSKLRERLSQLESFYHGKSSGIDPLVSYLNKSILRGRNDVYSIIELPDFHHDGSIFLVDSGKTRSTAEWVRVYQQKMENVAFSEKLRKQLVPSVEHAIYFFLNKSWEMFWGHLQIVSHFQKEKFSEMIPEHILNIWSKLDKNANLHQMKLCGAGGGGYFLVFSKNGDLTKETLNALKASYLQI